MFRSARANRIVTAAVILGLVVGFGAGFYAGTVRMSASPGTAVYGSVEGKPETVDFSLFWEAWNTLDKQFVGSSTPATKEKVWGAISGLTGSYGDPYTVFLPPEEAKAFEENVSGNFEGVGMEIGIRDQVLTVIAPIKGSPAFRAGVLAGDKILKINATSTEGLSVDRAVKFIRGPRGTSVTLTMLRGNGRPFELTVIRDRIDIPTIETERREDGVFVIRLFNFSATSAGLFRNALREFAESGSHLLVIDLRNNPGGYLEVAVDMASWFLPVGKVVVREDFGVGQEEKVYRSKGYDVFNETLRLAILVNGGSASASEILAGALHDHGKATVVGEKTFGKGSVQEVFPLSGRSSLKITIARWLTPNGVSISQGGLKPDVEVKPAPADSKEKKDLQLEKAVEILLNSRQ